jgi:chloramphenicol O-acetyltransferase type A
MRLNKGSMKKIDLNTWKRKEHFQHYNKFDDPFFGIVSEIDCTKAYEACKRNGYSFFAYYLYKSLLAVNQIEEFKTRILNDEVVVYDKINASSTIGREDGTFALSFLKFDEYFRKFETSLKKETEAVRNSSGLRLNENESRLDLIHYSSIPWSKFTGLTHARNLKISDSIPKIVFGKFFLSSKRKIMPVSINIHHGLADGLHVSRFLELFQNLMNED